MMNVIRQSRKESPEAKVFVITAHKDHSRGVGNIRSRQPRNVLLRRGRGQEVPAELLPFCAGGTGCGEETRLASRFPAHSSAFQHRKRIP